ncbi:MAG: 4-oxalocrotonate tautomerase family protein [Acidobacteria bacterium]|nr:4-oxalocrotonate tautomerase family protein [Acidobacteriota bacterium]
MPHIQIPLLEGRTPEQKRKIVERLTATMVEEAGTSREAVSVAFMEVSTASFARGGVLQHFSGWCIAV